MDPDSLIAARPRLIDIAESLIWPATDVATGGPARVRQLGAASHHGDSVDWLEAISRPLLLASILDRSTGNASHSHVFIDKLIATATGCVRGISWPDPNQNTKVCVEAAALALSFWISPQTTWECIPAATQEVLSQWFMKALAPSLSSSNNWQLFALPIAGFMTTAGYRFRELRVAEQRAWSAADKMYIGNGWYSDGGHRTFDYYNSFALHFYPAVTAFLSANEERLAQSRERLHLYLPQLAEHFTNEGAHVLFGRSLTYRSATAAAFALPGLVGFDAVPTDRWRNLLYRSLMYHADHGLLSGPVRLGWRQNGDGVPETYSGPLASYWLAKCFIGLLGDPASDYWTTVRGETPAARGDGTAVLATPGFALSSMGERRLVILTNHGSYDRTATDVRGRTDDPQYDRLQYSSRTAPMQERDSRSTAFTLSTRGLRWSSGRVLSCREHPIGLSSVTQMKPLEVRRGRIVRIARRALAGLFCGRVERATVFLGGWSIHMARFSGYRGTANVTYGGWPKAGIDGRPVSSRLLGLIGWSERIPGEKYDVLRASGTSRRPTVYVVATRIEGDEDPAPPTATSVGRRIALSSAEGVRADVTFSRFRGTHPPLIT